MKLTILCIIIFSALSFKLKESEFLSSESLESVKQYDEFKFEVQVSRKDNSEEINQTELVRRKKDANVEKDKKEEHGKEDEHKAREEDTEVERRKKDVRQDHNNATPAKADDLKNKNESHPK